MAQTLRRRLIDWGLAAVFLLVPALVLRASLRRPSELGAVDHAVLRVSAPLQSGVAWVVRRVASVWNGYVALTDVEDENRELRAENERLRRELSAMTRRAFDLESLEERAVEFEREVGRWGARAGFSIHGPGDCQTPERRSRAVRERAR